MLKVFRLVDGGARYYIAARDYLNAIAVWMETMREQESDDDLAASLASGIKIRDLTVEEARDVVVKEHDYDGTKRPLLQVIEGLGDKPEVVACSEWP
jgi:hypothetical protein